MVERLFRLAKNSEERETRVATALARVEKELQGVRAALGIPEMAPRGDAERAAIALRKQVAELQSALSLYAVFRGEDDDGGEHDECALCEARWPAENEAKHDQDCALAKVTR